MNNRILILNAFIALAVSSVHAKETNILFLLTDDQAYHTLGVNGNDQVQTPNIDELARRGVIFDRHYDTTSVCMGSRANIMSGMYEYKTGCNFMHGAMGTKQWATSYPVLLKKAGYRVANAGKFGFAVHDQKNLDQRGIEGTGVKDSYHLYLTKGGQCNYTTAKNKGLNRYEKDHPHLTQALAAASIDFMRDSVKQGQPFCMTVGFKAPHKPLVPDPQFDHVYQDTVWKKPDNYGRDAGLHLAEQSRQDRQYKRYWDEAYSTDEKYQHTLRVYHQLLYGVDVAVGKMVKELESLGIAGNTVIIYSSDNGYLMGAHGLGGKVLPYEEGSRAPLIIYDPRNPKSGTMRRTDSLSGNVDIAATILDAAGVKVPEVYDGKSLMPILADKTAKVRKTLPIIQVFGQEATRCLSVINGEYKYIYWYYTDEKQAMQPTEELFHLTEDPLEMTNLSSNPEYQPVLVKMRAEYDAQVKRWAEQSIDYNGYQEYGTLFDRHVPWETKIRIIPEKDATTGLRTKSGE
ncbi:Arylsulfatase [Planctomycetes bacterium CA13]|uniref:Arylsulfatase n=1 Tax=Novipirellula herctigrandis TaxID=2527986 RepID=A0A5C5Z067_9BACT|nr:Arylsulfatase [Planctomycetes bacterium CA13]